MKVLNYYCYYEGALYIYTLWLFYFGEIYRFALVCFFFVFYGWCCVKIVFLVRINIYLICSIPVQSLFELSVWLIAMIVISTSNRLFNFARTDSKLIRADLSWFEPFRSRFELRMRSPRPWTIGSWIGHWTIAIMSLTGHLQDATNGKQAYPIKSLYSN